MRKTMRVMALLATVAIAVLVTGWQIAGLQYRVITSGSMEPTLPFQTELQVTTVPIDITLPIKSAVVTRPVNTDQLVPEGDIITYREPSSGMIVTHRYMGIDEVSGSLITKGDNNEESDYHELPLTASDVEGEVWKVFDPAQIALLVIGFIALIMAALYLWWRVAVDWLEERRKLPHEETLATV